MTPAQARTGVAVIGLGGAVATTAMAGVEQLRPGCRSRDGLVCVRRGSTGHAVDVRGLGQVVRDALAWTARRPAVLGA